MIKGIKAIILELCEGKDWTWRPHVESVVKYSKILATKLGADVEICEIAAWLHDIEKIRGNKVEHHVRGSIAAEEILKKCKYPQERIDMVKHCILTHSSDEQFVPESKEAKIVASADALSHFDNFLALAYQGFRVKNLSLEEGREWLASKYKKSWDKLGLLPEARDIARPRYDAIKMILGYRGFFCRNIY